MERRIREAIRSAVLRTGRLTDLELSDIRLEKPREGAHGDLATNVAMVLASRTKTAPRTLAEEITAALELPADVIQRVAVAGPGFINLRLSPEYLRREAAAILRDGSGYGRSDRRRGKKVQLEFVSANPTGPLNVVSARAAAVGDALARILSWAGWEVETEFYVNDGGTQIDLFAASVRARFLEQGGFPFSFPEDGYGGSWPAGIAQSLWRLLQAVVETACSRRSLEFWSEIVDVSEIDRRWRDGTAEERAAGLAGAISAASMDRVGARKLAAWWLGELGGGDVLLESASLPLDREVRNLGQAWLEEFPLAAFSVALMVIWQRESLHGFGVDYDAEIGDAREVRGWFHESRLYEGGAVKETLQTLERALDAVYDKEGARWLATTRFGDEEDRVLVRRDGRPTYFLTDIAYHRDKLARGYDRVIDVWGPDHHGHIGRMKAAMHMLGANPDWLEVIIAQQVNVLKDGKPVKMSKRGGEVISLADVVEEAGRDTSRFFFLMRRTSSHLDFDLDLARKTSEENPVYYVQYAFARISSIYEFARQRNLSTDRPADLSLLTEPAELNLMRTLVRFPWEVRSTARALEPHRLTVYLQELAQSFHKFYKDHRIVGDDEAVSCARLNLVSATRIVLETGMCLVGVQPPKERM